MEDAVDIKKMTHTEPLPVARPASDTPAGDVVAASSSPPPAKDSKAEGGMDFTFQPMEDILEREARLGIQLVRPAPRISAKTLSRLSAPKKKNEKKPREKYVPPNAPRLRAPSPSGVPSEAKMPASHRLQGPAHPPGVAASTPSDTSASLYYVVVRSLCGSHFVALDRKTLLMSIVAQLPLPPGGSLWYRNLPVHLHATAVTLGLRAGVEFISTIVYAAPIEAEEHSARASFMAEQVGAWGQLLSRFLSAVSQSVHHPATNVFLEACGEYVDAQAEDETAEAEPVNRLPPTIALDGDPCHFPVAPGKYTDLSDDPDNFLDV